MTESKSLKFIKRYGLKAAAICFWLLIWELLSRWVVPDIFLASPKEVALTLFTLCQRAYFWKAIGFSSARIILGFILALVLGTLLAAGAYKSRIIKELVTPLMKLIKAMPVATFILLALLWINSRNLSILISFLMVIPLIYSNVLQGLFTTDEKLLQMARVYRISGYKRMIAIYIPAVLPYFISAISVGLGFCWKAGIAAEVIGFPNGSIGERLYEAKLYIMTKELFAWTAVIVTISIVFELAIMRLLQLLFKNSVSRAEASRYEKA